MPRNIPVLLVLSQVIQLCSTATESHLNVDKCDIPDLPAEHLIRYLNIFPTVKEACIQSKLSQTPANGASTDACWGHESNCDPEMRFQTPTCPGDHIGWMQGKKAQVNIFYNQADFGYIQQQIHELSLICAPTYLTDSSLECTKYLRFCRGRNLLVDFRDLIHRTELIRYHIDVLKDGQIMGHCKLDSTYLQAEMDHMGALQSWAPELRNFKETSKPVLGSTMCDLTVDSPTFFMKIDATYNMYHHFCDFFNLYASLFVNQSHHLSFHTDTRILIWESYPYDSPFAETFKAFSHHPIWTLNDVKGKRVCFRNLILPLLPRMIFGLYYNTPIINGCQSSGLFRAFSEFILHRLRIPFQAPTSMKHKVRITFLSRRTKYRQVLNEDELLRRISANESYHVRQISFERGLNFTEQLAITRNTDILIGMHGAGLTHLLFLPDWATIFELYNCEDPNCYKDLARLRGVNYITWAKSNLVYPQDKGNHPQGGAHAKFTNYSFEPEEFARLVAEAANHVISNSKYRHYFEPLKHTNPEHLTVKKITEIKDEF